MSVAGAWLAWCLVGHAALIRGHVTAPPDDNYFKAGGVSRSACRYLVSDYWVGYHVAFLTSERVRPGFDRVHEYLLSVDANREHAAEVWRRAERALRRRCRGRSFLRLCAGGQRADAALTSVGAEQVVLRVRALRIVDAGRRRRYKMKSTARRATPQRRPPP